MSYNIYIATIFIPVGILCLFRPIVFIYVFILLPVLKCLPVTWFGDAGDLNMARFGSISVYVQDYLIFLMGLFLLKQFRYRKRFQAILNSPVTKIALAFFFWKLCIGLLSYAKGFELQNVLRGYSIESYLLIAILIPAIGRIEEKKNGLLNYSILVSILLVIFAFLKYTVFGEVSLTSSATTRSLHGDALPIILFSLCYVLFYGKLWQNRPLLSFLFVLFLSIGIHFTGHRSAWIAFLFVITLWFFSLEKKIEFAWIPLWGFSLCTVLVLATLFIHLRPGTVFGDFAIRIYDTFDMQNATTQERLEKWETSFRILGDYPLLGMGRFSIYSLSAGENEDMVSSLKNVLNRPPHNLFATTAIHEGLLGLGVLALFFYIIFIQFGRASPSDRKYYLFLKVYLMAFILFSLFNTTFTSSHARIYFFVALGLLNATLVKNRSTADSTYF